MVHQKPHVRMQGRRWSKGAQGQHPLRQHGREGGVCSQCLHAELSRRCHQEVGVSMLRWSGCVLYKMILFHQCRNIWRNICCSQSMPRVSGDAPCCGWAKVCKGAQGTPQRRHMNMWCSLPQDVRRKDGQLIHVVWWFWIGLNLASWLTTLY